MRANVPKHGLEQLMFPLTMFAAAALWFVVLASAGVVIAIGLAAGAWITQEFFLATLVVDSVRVGPHQLTKLWHAYTSVGERLGVSELPPLYLQQSGGVLNAFAARLARRMVVVLQSGLVEALEHDPEALEFVIGHELGHHIGRHTTLSRHVLTAPLAMFGLALLQLGLSRGQEFTADRYGLHGAPDLRSAERAIMVLLGGRLAGAADANTIQAQWHSAGFVGRLLEFLRSHPSSPRRIAQLREYAHVRGSSEEPASPSGQRGWTDSAEAGAATQPLNTTLVSPVLTSQAPRAR